MMLFLLILATAFVLDAVLGDPRSTLHPVALMGTFAKSLERVCRKIWGNSVEAGGLAWFMLVLVFTAAAYLSVYCICSLVGYIWGTLLAGVWLYVCIALRSLWQHAEKIRRALMADNLVLARQNLAMIVSRDTVSLDESEIVRGAVESLGENLVDAVNSAVFWAALGFILGGAPLAAALAVLLRAANTLDACWGYKNERYLYFGRIAARVDDALHYLPARLSLPVIALAAMPIRGSLALTLRCGLKHRRDHQSPNSAWGMAAFAGALGVRLGGPTVYHGVTENNPYLGQGRTRLNAGDIRRAQLLAVCAALLFAVLMLAIVFLVAAF